MEAQRFLKQKQNGAKDEIAQLAAAKEAAEAQVKVAQVQFGDTVLIAPFDGIVTQKEATEGDIVSPSLGAGSSSIVEIARGLEILAKVPEVDVGQLKIGQKVNIVADAYPDKVFQGKVNRIAPEAKIENNVTSFEIRIALVTGLEQLRSKMNVDVSFLGEEIDNALVVPTVAIVTQKGQTGVMIPDRDNKPKFKSITIGLTLQDKTQVLEGLTTEERVFVDLPQDGRMMRN
jgi:HlyD family secretion protein